MSSLLVKSGLSIVAGFAMSSCGVQSDLASGGSKVEPQPAEPCPVLVAQTVKYKKDKHGMASYKDSDRKRYVRTTSYSHMENEPGAPGRKNAAGTILKYGSKVRSAGADWSVYPLGTKFKIKGQPYIYVVDDYGSALANTNTIDIFKPSLKGMRKWGTRHVEITVIQWGCYERSRKLLRGRRGYWHCRDMYNKIVRKMNSGHYAKLENDEMDAL